MRRIEFDPSKLEYPDDWLGRAADLLEQLKNAEDDTQRRTIIEENGIWAELKSQLRALSHGKCWYTEAGQYGTDVDVDHFRPKRRVAELVAASAPHPGYWWLAFEPLNYRYSCIVANRRRQDVLVGKTGGKADHFPIQDEADRAGTLGSAHDAEKRLLIDPCVAGEPELITFKDDGEAMPRFPSSQPYKHLKAEKSIELYSINHSDFVRVRIDLRDQIERLKADARKFYSKLETGDAVHEAGYASAISQLSRLRSDQAPFSAFCSTMIDRARHEDYMYGLYNV